MEKSITPSSLFETSWPKLGRKIIDNNINQKLCKCQILNNPLTQDSFIVKVLVTHPFTKPQEAGV